MISKATWGSKRAVGERTATTLCLLVMLSASASLAAPVGMAFTYQGQLKLNGNLVTNSSCYFTFSLFDASSNGAQIGQVPLPTIGQQGMPITVGNGFFTVDIDFGAGAFNGSARWLETAVCCLAFPFPVGSTCTQTSLTPRQPVNPVPYALGLRLPLAQTATTAQPGIAINNMSQGDGLRGTSNGCAFPEGCFGGAGVAGENTADGAGVWGMSQGGYGVYGFGYDAGVRGESTTSNGVAGWSSSAGASGVYGEHTGGYGVAGRTSGTGAAVYGDNTDQTGWAGYFKGRLGVTGMVKANGGFQTGGADIAERVESAEQLEPGDVVEIDPRHRNRFRCTSSPYSTLTVGIVSTAPGVTLNSPTVVSAGPGIAHPVLALAGRVPVKVTAANGPIAIGDLLTPSALPGYAMRCEERTKCVGAIVGKALEPLGSGTGLIKTFVTLQ